MYVVGRRDMESMDRYTIEQIGLPGAILMENAGTKVAEAVDRLSKERHLSPHDPIVILAGHGNNGGDGFVAARRLADLGYAVLLCLISPVEKLKGDALLHFEVYRRRQLPLWVWREEAAHELWNHLAKAKVVVDALLGTGVQREVRSPYREVIRRLNEMGEGKIIVSVDLPSGLCADTGEILGEAVKATHTVTMACPKKGFFLQAGPQVIGEWQVAEISIPPSLAERLPVALPRLITPEAAAKSLPPRPPHGHKGTFGHVLVVGGSAHYVGAPLMTALAALASGAGLVTLAVPETIYPYVAAQSPLPIFLPLTVEQGRLGRQALQELDERLSQYDVMVVGPGLGRWPEGSEWLKHLLKKWGKPAVIDADALTLIKPVLAHFSPEEKERFLLTPHPGEMARLMGISVDEVEGDRLGVSRRFAQKEGVYLVLKGHRTIVITPSGQQWINPLGHSALGKGGAGDVLAGMLAAILAQKASMLEAGLAAVYLHALAGEQCALKKSSYAVLATDLITQLGQAIASLSSLRPETCSH